MKGKRKLGRMLIVVVLLILLIAGCGSDPTPVPTNTLAPTKAPVPTSTPLPTATTPPPAAAVTLGEEQRSEMGGFAFQPIPDYAVKEQMGFVSIEAPDADPDIGPAVLMMGGQGTEGLTLEQFYEQTVSDVDVPLANRREVTVGGLPGLAVDVSASQGGQEIAGRIVVVVVGSTQHFSMLGSAPRTRWDDEFEPLFEAVLASVRFFEPVTAAEPSITEPEMVEVEIRQWASSAQASSWYGEEGDPDWAPEQATGAPDTPQCGDWETAWASASSDGVEWLELAYETPVRPSQVNIIQTYNPNQVVQVELLDTEGNYHSVYSSAGEDLAECPYTLSISVEGADYEAVGVKITIDQSLIEIWNEIDAVELVGWGEGLAGTVPEATATAATEAVVPPPAYTGEVRVLAPPGWASYTNANFVEDVALDDDGNLWAVGPGGVIRWSSDGSYTKYTATDGLARNVVNAVAVAPDGSLWFGTRDGGVSHFDGQTWTTYTYKDGLASSTVTAIAVAPDGALWFGHSGYGVTRFDGETWTTYSEEDGLVDDTIYDMAIAPDGAMWFATWDGVSCFDGETWTNYAEEDGLADDTTYAVALDADGSVWFGTYNGVSRFDGQTWTTYGTADGLAGSIVDAIAIAPDGVLWFSVGGSFDTRGVSRFDGQSWTHYDMENGLADQNVNDIVVTPGGDVWLGYDHSGVSYFDGDVWTTFTTDDQVLNNELWAVAVAPDGSLWIGSDEAGAAHFDGQTWTRYTGDDGLVSDVVLTIVPAPDGSVWFGTGYGVSHFDGGTWTNYSEETGMPFERVDYLALAADGSVWVGTWATVPGVARFDGQTWSVYSTEDGLAYNGINGLAATPDGSVWFATGEGVSRFDGQSWTTYTEADGLASKVAKSIAVAPDGAVWVGTWGGVSRFDPSATLRAGGQAWTNYSSQNIIFTALAVASDGTLWAGNETLSEALFHFDGQAWTTFTTQDGLADQSILEIAAGPDGTVWIGTRGGLSSFGH